MKKARLLCLATALPLSGPSLAAQNAPGLRLFAPVLQNQVQLVDGQGSVVHSWPGTNNVSVALAGDGSLVRSVIESIALFPGSSGRLQRLDLDGNLTWDLVVNSPQRLMHHDIELLPNGNVLLMVVDYLSRAEGIAAGRDPALLPAPEWLPESILEIQQTGPTTGQVVWEWHVQDHLVQDFDPGKANYGVVSDHPELVDINYPAEVLQVGDWNHANGIDYDPVHDWIVISARSQDEVWLIDHGTTSAEAASHTGGARGRGGDLLWRWGNPQAYGRGTPAHQQLFQQHDPRFVPPGFPGAGHITIFNNQHLPNRSAVIEIELPLDAQGMPFVESSSNVFGPAGPVWTFTEPGFFSSFISSAQRLANGNTLICSGASSRLFEVTASGQTVWDYTEPSSAWIFQAHSVDRRLWASTDELSVAAGGVLDFTHIVDTERSGDVYYLLGSFAGTSPGTLLPGGVVLPLNVDALLLGMVAYPNVGVFVDTVGTIDANGGAASAVLVPPGLLLPVLIGQDMSLVHALIDGTGFVVEVSNVVTVTMTL